MAGKRQHYLPRFLQRGFLIADEQGGERTWLHRPNAPPRPVGIRDIGVADWFYSRAGGPGEVTLDDIITEHEREMSGRIAALRQAAPGTVIEPRDAAKAVVHLVIRTAHLRRTLTEGMDGIMDEITGLFTDPARLEGMLGVRSPAVADVVSGAIRNAARELAPLGFPAELTERLMTFMVRERGAELSAGVAALLAAFLPDMMNGFAERLRDSHNSLLGRSAEEAGWVDVLERLHWTLEAAEDLILPDCVALSRTADGPLGPLLFTSGDETELVLLPLAAHRLLVGRSHLAGELDREALNRQAAAACQNFFIAARPHWDDGLVDAIGQGPAEALSEAIREAVAGAEEARRIAGETLPHARPQTLHRKEFSVSLSLKGFGDAALAEEYADVLQAVLSALAPDLPLQELEGITIAADYAQALETLDRGDPALPPVTSSAPDYGLGVAMPVKVIRGGERKHHLVLAAGVADGWTSSDSEVRAMTLHVLVSMLAGIADATRFAEPIGFKADAMARELHLAVAGAPSSYFCAKTAAFVAPDQGSAYAELVLNGLEHVRSSVAAARAAMVNGSDVAAAFSAAWLGVRAVLGHAADWLGHRDGLADGQPFRGSDLPARLAPFGLDHWLELFGRDLAACYTADEGALDLSVVTTLSRHVERLFWSLGLYCWPLGEGVHCVVSDFPFVPVEPIFPPA